MSQNKGIFATALSLVLIFAVFVLILVGVNVFAAPLIQSNGSAALLAPLYEVMPSAAGFELLYDGADGAASTLADVPATVRSVYRETGGLGYALTLSTSEGYTKQPIEITMGVDSQGKICGIALNAYPDSRELGADYVPAYVGQDSALGGVSLVSGATYSSKAFQGAVTDGFNALIGNGLIGAGVKSDEQLLTELMLTVYPGIATSEGAAQYEEVTGTYTYVTRAMKAANGGGMAYLTKDGDKSYLAVCSLSGSCRVYDTDGADVTATVSQDLVSEVTADAAANLTSLESADQKVLSAMVSADAQFTELPLDGIFSSVTGAYLITDGENQYYGFAARPYGYGNLPLTVGYVLDGNGAIVGMNADELILMGEYFTSYELDKPSYQQAFAGLTGDTFTGEQALISGATITSNAVHTAVTDVFAAFAAVAGNGGAN
jgi:Na+-translocating ferredoxin:NAD+ oxidoreductase RnfG subunit